MDGNLKKIMVAFVSIVYVPYYFSPLISAGCIIQDSLSSFRIKNYRYNGWVLLLHAFFLLYTPLAVLMNDKAAIPRA